MKTPWQFLATLRRGRRGQTERATPSAVLGDDDTPPDGSSLSDIPSPGNASLSGFADGVAYSTEPSSKVVGIFDDRLQAVGEQGGEVTHGQTTATVHIESSSILPAATSAVEPLAKGFRMVSRRVAGKSATVSGNKLDLSLGTAKTFLNVQLELNREINELREQLKRKLELQNAQLRMMLDRYEQILPSVDRIK